MRVLDLFSGIGGFSLGLERAGMQTVGFCEIDPFCRLVLRKHWPEVWIHDDVQTLTAPLIRERCGHIDLLCGGFPCQDISSAGKGAGLDGSRSGLWWELCGIIARIRPAWLLIENVPALRTRGADRVLSCLEGIGYSVWPLVVGAWAVGAPHKRDRVWIVGRLADAAVGRNDQRGGVPIRPGGSHEASPDAFGAGEGLANADECGRGIDEPGREPQGGASAGRTGSGIDNEQLARGIGSSLVPTTQKYRSIFGFNQLADAACRGLGADGSPRGDAGHADEREPSMGHAKLQRLEGQRSDAGKPQIAQPWDAGAHGWPARPGEPQHEWEAPRLLEFGLGSAVAGLPERLVRRRNKLALKAYGNTVVPQVVEAIGRAIMEAAAC